MSAALARARAATGVPFRLHGRDGTGMDCIGLVAFAWATPAPTGYAMRSGARDVIAAALADLGFAPAAPEAGAVVLFEPGPGQSHLAIATGDGGIVHADAIARRVVERPAPLPWPLLAAWTRKDPTWRR